MQRNKTKKRKKFRILLDAAFAKPEMFPHLNKKANLTHCVHTYHMSPQAEDKDIYQKAIEEKRFVLTINFRDFRELVRKDVPGILGIESQLSNDQIDRLVTSFLSDKDPKEFIGKAIRIPLKEMG